MGVGEPRPDITWYHNEKQIVETDRHKYSMELDAKLYYLCRLEILNVDARDMGTYKAVARNASGEGNATINLTFEQGSGGEKPKIPDGIPPRFPKKPSIKQEGDDLILECILEANPLPEITWYRKDKVIKEDSRITWECKKGKKNRFLLTLRIKNPSLKDAGMYRCNAFNSFGDSNANIDLKFETDEEPGAAKTEGDSESALSGIPPTFTEKPKIVPNEKGTLVTLKFKINADPKPEIQWFKGMDKIQDSAKFTQKYTALSANNEYEIALEIQDPSADDGGDYKCLVKNKMGQLQAKLNLNIEAEPAVTPGGETTDAPTFVEKPKIVTLNEGKLVQLIVKYKASSKCTCSWYYKETLIQQSQSIQVFHESISKNEYECRLEIQEPGPNTAGMYKCLVSNEKGEINANLMLNIQMAGQSEVTTDSKSVRKTSETTKMSVKKERRRSVILQCAVLGQSDVDIVWKKGGQTLETTESKKTSRYSVEKKMSTNNQTIIQLEIMDADIEDKGVYELVAKSSEGERQSQIVELTEEQVKLSLGETEKVKLSLQAQEDAEKARAKKKKKKKPKTAKKEVIKPEISSFLKNQIIKEGENIEMKCRLDEEIDPEDVTVTWYFNDTEFVESDRVQITFDGTYAKLFVASTVMSDAGVYKVKFQNEQGEDETQGKVQIKPAPKIAEAEESEPDAKQPGAKLDIKRKDSKKPSVGGKSEEPEAGEGLKLGFKKKSGPRKLLPKEEEQPAFAGMKLKKAQTVKREWDDGGLEKVDLKHHEFEKPVQEEKPEKALDIIQVSEALPDDDGKGKKKKKVKKTTKKGVLVADQESQDYSEGDEDEAVTDDIDTELQEQQQHLQQKKSSAAS